MSKFDLQELQQFEGVETVVYRDVMTSTSDVARHTLSMTPDTEMPLLVLCDQQTAGRGQPGKKWQSDADSLTFTWCVRETSVPPGNHLLLPLIVGICVCQAIESIGVKGSKLKWPNDVLINQNKVCGILVEKISARSRASFLVGIGINVNQADPTKLPTAHSQFPPSSLRICGGQSIDPEKLLLEVVKRLQSSVTLEKDWLQQCEALLEFIGTQVDFEKPDGEVVKGIFRGIDDTGKIEISVDGHHRQLFSSGHLSPRAQDH
jgi:BirA family biotin operon repressor/biotin-[acetyl-CoA-carboxylase] ligase